MKHTPPRRTGRKRRPDASGKGVGLVELLVGMGMGLLVTLAALGSLVQTRLSSTAVSESTRMQQDASTAMRILGQQIRQAGAPGLEDTPAGKVVFRQDFADDPSTPWGISGTDGGALGHDTLVVSHSAITSVDDRDCLSQTPAGTVNRSSFRVAAQELQCLGSASRPTYQGVVSGVEDFQVWYGVRQDARLQYQVASAVTPWSQVVSVQICLVLMSEQRGYPVTARAMKGCHGTALDQTDGRLRRVIRQVFKLRHADV